MAIGRVICGEILDRLPADDPSALRSRLDLLAINALMGNIRWVRRALRRAMKGSRKTSAPGGDAIRFVEIGAGDGRLCRKVARWFPDAIVTGLDLAPRPAELPRAIFWRQGDLFEELPGCAGEALVGTLILHHFPNESLIRIGRMLRDTGSCAFASRGGRDSRISWAPSCGRSAAK